MVQNKNFPNAVSQPKSFAVLRTWWTPLFWEKWVGKKYEIHIKNTLISDVMFKIKVFPVQLANQSLLLYWDLDGPKAFNQYLNRNMLMIFGKGWSLEKKASNTC